MGLPQNWWARVPLSAGVITAGALVIRWIVRLESSFKTLAICATMVVALTTLIPTLSLIRQFPMSLLRGSPRIRWPIGLSLFAAAVTVTHQIQSKLNGGETVLGFGLGIFLGTTIVIPALALLLDCPIFHRSSQTLHKAREEIERRRLIEKYGGPEWDEPDPLATRENETRRERDDSRP